MKARPYQQEAIDALFAFFSAHRDPEQNPVVAMPTGTGKAFVIAEFMRRVLVAWPGQRILNLVHVKELVDQNAKTLLRIWPQAPVGVFSAGLRQRVAHMPITFAGTKSVAANLSSFGRQDIILVDECQLIPDEDESEYMKVLAYFRALNPHVRIIGLSATPFRMGLGMVTDGKIFSHVAYDVTGLVAFNHLLEEGYLAPLIPIQTEMIIDVSRVAKQGGEFKPGELTKAVNREELTRAALTETLSAARSRRHWLIFAAGIEHVEAVHKVLTEEFGVSAVAVHGKMPAAARDEALRAFRAGEVRACVNNNILTTGFDMPWLDCIVCLRPTNSVVLHVQMLGRGTRPWYAPGYDLDEAEGRLDAIAASPKHNCLVLDFAGNVTRLGPINDPRIPKRKGEGGGEAPVKLCDHCCCLNHISNRFCDNCGEPFPIEEKITDRASTAELIAKVEQPDVKTFDVGHVVYETHVSPGKPLMLRASYYCGVQRFSELVLLEHHHSGIINKARKWWRERAPEPVPETVGDAIRRAGEINQPRQVRVWVNHKPPGSRKMQPKVMGCVFDAHGVQEN